MNNDFVYNNARESYSIRGDMCYDNKVMMNTAHPERTFPQATTLNIAEPDKNTHPQKTTFIRKLRSRLRVINPIDILIIVIVGALVLLIEMGYIPNTKLGFFCKDPSISHQFRGDTISGNILIASAYIGPIFVITLVEVLREQSFTRVRVGTVWRFYKECLIGTTLVLLITEVIKVLVGEQRPHFLDTCEPDANRNCLAGTFIQDYNCTNTRLSLFTKTDIMRSFPSGHTSISMFVALFCSYLVQTRISEASGPRLMKPLLIAVCLSWSLFCSLSRITDRRHHWWDVLAGAFLGICGAYYMLTALHRREHVVTMVRTNTSTTTLLDVKNKDATSVII